MVDAQSRLDSSYARAGAEAKSVSRSGGSVTFTPYDSDTDGLPAVHTEFTTAQGIVEETIEQVQDRGDQISQSAQVARTLKTTWAAAADGSDPGWDVPDGYTFDVQTTTLGSTTVVTTGDSNDRITVDVDPATGETVLTVASSSGTETVRIPAGQDVVINTGKGDDEIVVPDGTTVRLRFATGEGDDMIDAQGAEGDIEAFTGTGDDQVEGAEGNDRLFGGADEDVISGGFGADRLWGGDGNDTIYAGGGDDVMDGQGGLADQVFAEAYDQAPGGEHVVIVEIPAEEDYLRWLEFEVGGTEEFRARVLADLQMMASSPVGQKMLERMNQHYDESDDGWFDFSKEKVTISQNSGDNNSAGYGGPTGFTVALDPTHMSQGYPMGYTDPDYDSTPPSVFFLHELGHINQYRSGEDDGQFDDPTGRKPYSDGSPLIERQNVGLPWDYDSDPGTAEAIDPDYDFDYTENGFREELGIPPRNQY